MPLIKSLTGLENKQYLLSLPTLKFNHKGQTQINRLVINILQWQTTNHL